jgi:hypothetical protein
LPSKYGGLSRNGLGVTRLILWLFGYFSSIIYSTEEISTSDYAKYVEYLLGLVKPQDDE